MKKVFFICIFLLCFCLQPGAALVKNTPNEDSETLLPAEKHDARWLRYDREKKEPWVAVGLAWLFPTVGHGYAGDWGRGVPFFLGEAASVGIMLSGVKHTQETTDFGYGSYTTTKTELTSTYYVGLGLLLAFRVWEYFDAYATAEQANQELRQELKISEEEYTGTN